MFALRQSARLLGKRSLQVVGSKVVTPAAVKLVATPARFMSSHLANTVLAEIKYEEKMAKEELNEDYVSLKKEMAKTWKISSSPGSAVVTLTRDFKGETITVKFNVHEIERGEDDDDDEPVEDENDEEGGGPRDGINFTVTIDKKEAGVIALNLYGDDGSLSVHNIRYGKNSGELEKEDGYSGPYFPDLDDTLQEEFYKYLEDRGIDDELANFVLNYANEKEEAEYLGWLKNVHAFVTK